MSTIGDRIRERNGVKDDNRNKTYTSNTKKQTTKTENTNTIKTKTTKTIGQKIRERNGITGEVQVVDTGFNDYPTAPKQKTSTERIKESNLVRRGLNGENDPVISAAETFKAKQEANELKNRKRNDYENTGYTSVKDWAKAEAKNVLPTFNKSLAESAKTTAKIASKVLDNVPINSPAISALKVGANIAANSKLYNDVYDYYINQGEKTHNTAEYYRNTGKSDYELPILNANLRTVVGSTIESASNNLPNMAVMMMSGGTTAAANAALDTEMALATQGLSNVSNYQRAAQIVTKAANNPSFYTSLASMLGPTYYKEIENGATETEALASALASSVVNSQIEIGGGLENVNGLGKAGIRNTISELMDVTKEEATEEIKQYFIENLMNKAVGSNTSEWFSMNPETDAVINPTAMAQQGIYGGLGGLAYGGPGIAVNNALGSYAESKADNRTDAQRLAELMNNMADDQTDSVKVSESLEKFFEGSSSRKGRITEEDFKNIESSLNAKAIISEVLGEDVSGYTAEQLKEAQKQFKQTASGKYNTLADEKTLYASKENPKATASGVYSLSQGKRIGDIKSNKEIVESYAEKAESELEKSVLKEAYDENQDPIKYIQGMASYINAGKNGDITKAYDDGTLNEAQKAEAIKIGENYAEGLHLRNSSERDDSSYTGRQVRIMEESSGEAGYGQFYKAKDVQFRQVTADREIKSSDILEQGTDEVVYEATDNFTNAMNRAKAKAVSQGKTVHFFGKGYVETNSKNKIGRHRGFIHGDEIWVRYDDPDYTAEQIIEHELYHPVIANKEVRNAAINKVKKSLGKREWDKALEAYRQAYDGSDFTDDYLIDEMLCDFKAGMNIFSGGSYIMERQFEKTVSSAHSTLKNTETNKAPPAEEIKFSTSAVDNAKAILDSNLSKEEKTAALKFSTVRVQEDVLLHRTAKGKEDRHGIRVFTISENDGRFADIPDLKAEYEIDSLEKAEQANTNKERIKDWRGFYKEALGFAERSKAVIERKGGKLDGVTIAKLTTGCQRTNVTMERVHNGILPNTTRLESCYGGTCFTNYGQFMRCNTNLDYMEVKDLTIVSPEVFRTWFKDPKFVARLKNAPFIRHGEAGDDSHLFGSGVALEWLKCCKEAGIKTKNVFISASYAPVTEEMYRAYLPYKDLFELHLSNSGWFHKNEIMIRLNEYVKAKRVGLNACIRLVTNADNIDGAVMVNQEFIDKWIKKLHIDQKDIIETPYHNDSTHESSESTGTYKNICCETGACLTCKVGCMTTINRNYDTLEAELRKGREAGKVPTEHPNGYSKPEAQPIIIPKGLQQEYIDKIKELGFPIEEYEAPKIETRFSMVGKKAKTADMYALGKAEFMDGRESVTDIWKETGWIKGKDGQWRFEIDDSKMRLKNIGMTSGRKLADVIYHPLLFKAYPQLKEVPVTIKPVFGKNYMGEASDGKITLNIRKLHNKEDYITTLLHEIQHLIQDEEGFESGGNSEAFAKIIKYEADKTFIRLLGNEYLFAPEKVKRSAVEKYLYQLYNVKNDKKLGEEIYDRILGEREAYETEARRKFSQEERRQNIPQANNNALVRGVDYVSLLGEPSEITLASYLHDEIENRNSLSGKNKGDKVRFSTVVDSEGNNLTNNQAEYFKDSKVRDKDGNLLVVYHGTTNQFTKFERSKISRYDFGYGFYYTADRYAASEYAVKSDKFNGGNNVVMEGYLNITNPLNSKTIEYMTEDHVRSMLEDWQDNELFEDDIDDTMMDLEQFPDDVSMYNYLMSQVSDQAEALSYVTLYTDADGIIADAYGGKYYVSFDSNQFKDIKNENPTENPDINFSTVVDKKYMELAKNPEGNREELQKMVDEAARKAGYTEKMFHQTDTPNITVFDMSIGTHGGTDSETPYGIFTKRTASDIGLGNIQMKLYVKAGKVLRFKNRSEVKKYFGGEYSNILDQIDLIDSRYSKLYDDAVDREMDLEDEFLEEHPEIDTTAMSTEEFLRGDFYTGEEVRTAIEETNAIMKEWTDAADRLKIKAKKQLTDMLRNKGFNSVEIMVDEGTMGRSTDTLISLDNTAVKSADLVTYDDNGEIIPLSERFNSTSDDIRYSTVPQGLAELQKENRQLKAKVESLSKQTKVSKEAFLNENDVKKLTNMLIKDHSSKADKADIEKRLSELGKLTLKDQISYDELEEKANEIAYDIVSNASKLIEDESTEQIKAIKEYFKGKKIHFEGDPNKYQDIRKHINVVKNGGTQIDSIWEELNELFGEEYFSLDVENAANMIEVVNELVSTSTRQYENPYYYYFAEAQQYAANYILDAMLPEPIMNPEDMNEYQKMNMREGKTMADEYEDKLQQKDNEVSKLKGKMAEDKEKQKEKDYQQRWKEAEKDFFVQLDKAKMKANYDKTIDKVKAQRDSERRKRIEQVAGIRTKTKEQKLRAKIQKHCKDLTNTLLHGTDKKHIPDELINAVSQVLTAINLESADTYKDGTDTKRTKAFIELRKAIEKVNENRPLTLDERIFDDDGYLKELIENDKPIAKMNLEELQMVWETLKATEFAVRSYNKLFSKLRYEGLQEIAEILQEDNSVKEIRKTIGKGNIQTLFGLDMMTPEAYFHRLGKVGDALFRSLRDGQDNYIRIVRNASEYTDKIVDESGVDIQKLRKESVEVKLGGEKVTLTKAQLIDIYNLLARGEQAVNHMLYGGGLDIASTVKNKTTHKVVRGVTIEEITEACTKLNVNEIAFADAMRKYLSTELSAEGNKASNNVYGYSKFNEDNYWPIRVSNRALNSQADEKRKAPTPGNKGFTKNVRPKANKYVSIEDAIDVYSAHIAEMATYASYLAPTQDLTRILNWTFRNEEGEQTGRMKETLDRVFGKGGYQYWLKVLTDVSMGIQAEKDYMGGFTANYKAASVGLNLRVVVQQPTSILRAMSMVNPKYFVKMSNAQMLQGWEKAKKYSMIAQWKDWGYFDINTGKSIQNILFGGTKVEKAKEISMMPAAIADSLTWGYLWNTIEKEVHDKNPEYNGEVLYQKTAERFAEVVDHTQVVDGILQRSQIMRSGSGLTRMATSFMGEPTKQYNMFFNAVYDFKNGDKSKLAPTVGALFLAGMVNAAVQSLVDALRGDDKDKDYWEKFFNNFFGFTGEEATIEEYVQAFLNGNLESAFNIMQNVPFAKDVMSIIQGYSVDRMDMSSIENVVDAVNGFYRSLNGTGKNSVANATTNLVGEIARLFGIPIANVKRDILSIITTYGIESENYRFQYELDKILYNSNNSSVKGDMYNILYNAMVNDKEAYNYIYKDMLENGFKEDSIKSAMDKRKKENISVKDENKYLEVENKVIKSKYYKTVDESRRNSQLQTYKSLVAGVENTDTERMQEIIDEGKKVGLTVDEFIIYKLAVIAADMENTKVNEDGESLSNGSPDADEIRTAMDGMNLTEKEKDWLWYEYEGYKKKR